MNEQVFSAFELIRDFGERVSSRACSCCKQFKLYAIRYPDNSVLHLCTYCDVETSCRR